MQWIDVAGLPGSGKSTICNPLWVPTMFRVGDASYPPEWEEFIVYINDLIDMMHQKEAAGCRQLNHKAFTKMVRVIRTKSSKIFMQTAFVQRGLGIGWRLPKIEDVAGYFRLMPVSIGVAFLDADDDTLRQRNLNRGKDYSWMIDRMRNAMGIAHHVLHERGVPLIKLDTTRSVNDNRADLLAFADSTAKAAGSRAA